MSKSTAKAPVPPATPEDELVSSQTIALFNDAVCKQHSDVFFKTFQRSLTSFWHPLFGFSVVRFSDQVVKPGHDESSHEAIVRQYGLKAARLVTRLIAAAWPGDKVRKATKKRKVCNGSQANPTGRARDGRGRPKKR